MYGTIVNTAYCDSVWIVVLLALLFLSINNYIAHSFYAESYNFIPLKFHN